MAHCSTILAALHPVPPGEALVTVVVELEFVVLLVVSVVSVVAVVNCCFPPRSGSAGGSSVIRLLAATTVAVATAVELLPVVAGCT